MSDIVRLQEMVIQSNKIVFFGGAGVSTESGIPDFRSPDGLYNQKYEFPPETMLSRGFFDARPADFFKFYRDKMILSSVKPNITHYKLAELEEAGKLSAVITQNIDGLHQLAGAKNVCELHGSVLRNFCKKCKKAYDVDYISNNEPIPYCECGGIVKPDVVLYGESLDDNVMRKSVKYISEADMLIIGGTSLVVYPAAGLVDYFKGKYIVVLNKSETGKDGKADLVIRDSIGKVMEQIHI